MTMMATPMSPSPYPPSRDSDEATSSGRLIATDGRTLPLRATSIEVTARGGVARVVLKQRFHNPYEEPLTVRYQVPLPADGAVSGFAFQLGDKRIVGEIDEKKKARARYESAIVEGRSAALLEQDRSSLFTQDVGNIPPGEDITAEILVDQKLRWLPEGSWEWRFPTVVAPRFSGEPGRVSDAAKLSVDVSEDELDVRANLALAIEDELHGRPESPSHGIATGEGRGATQVTLRGGAARLDRDVVVRWPVAAESATTSLAVARPDASHSHAADGFGLLTVVPPLSEGAMDEVERDLIVLIDTSGSMHGEPLAQARRVCMALVESLGEDDHLEMIEFSWRPTRWKRRPVLATASNKKSARKWLEALEANGGTQMREGILAALQPLRDNAQRQVVLISDGLIGFESEIVREIADRLPAGSRVHTVGVGSGVNRSLTGPAARAGRGIESIIGIGEDAERAAARLVAHTAAPVLVDLEVTGGALRGCAPERLPDLMAGAPALVALRLDPRGGELVVSGTTPTGKWQERVTVPALAGAGEGHPGLTTLFARERVEDLEIARAAGHDASTIDTEVTELGLAFQIATRLTSWVAVSEDPTVDPTSPSRREKMPHELPYGMSVQKLGLRQASGGPPMVALSRSMPMMPAAAPMAPPPPPGYGGRRRQDSFTLADEPYDADDAAELEEGGAFELPADMEEAQAETAAAPPPARRPPPALERKLEAPLEKKRKRSLRERVADGIRGVLGRDELRGTIVIHEEERLVVTITVSTAMRWEPENVVLELEDGSVVTASVIPELTTRPVDATTAQVLRLALRWTGGALAATPRRIRVDGPAGTLTIAVS